MSKEDSFQYFLNCLIEATGEIKGKYFHLPVTYTDFIFRERGYCYELYHQIRKIMSDNYPYLLSGEIDKNGHPLIQPTCGSIIPDFLVHRPGYMGPDDNLIIIEVKNIQGATYFYEDKTFLKDIDTINCMTKLPNGYYKGILLIYGCDTKEKKNKIVEVYNERCNRDTTLLIFHNKPNEKAILYK